MKNLTLCHQIATSGSLPKPTTGHSLVQRNGSLYLFGGEDENGYVNDLHEFIVSTAQWWFLPLKNSIPGRAYHSAVVLKNKMIVFGGKTSGNVVSDELWSLNFRNLSWNLLKASGDKPTKRFGHTAVAYGDKMILFGGLGVHLSNCVYELKRVKIIKKLPFYKWKRIPCGNVKPPKRYFHSAAILNHCMYIFGGHGITVECFLHDLWAFNLDTHKWKQIHTYGDIPQGVYNHSACICGGSMFVFGGHMISRNFGNFLYEFSISSREWKRIEYTGHIPECRGGHRAVNIEDHMFIFGGYSEYTGPQAPQWEPSFLRAWIKIKPQHDLYVFEVCPSIRGNRSFKKVLRNFCYNLKFSDVEFQYSE